MHPATTSKGMNAFAMDAKGQRDGVTAMWGAVCAYVQRLGYPRWEAEDLTQDLFLQLVRRGTIGDFVSASESPEHLRARLYLAARRVVINAVRHGSAQRRAGGRHSVSLDAEAPGAERMAATSEQNPATEVMFREAKAEIVANVRAIVRSGGRSGRATRAAVAREYLLPDSRQRSYKAAAEELRISPGNLGVMVHRLRRELREQLLRGDSALGAGPLPRPS